jgi:hypothetical protein
MNWQRASQRDAMRAANRARPIASTVQAKVPTLKQVNLIARLARELGEDPPHVTSSRGASYVIGTLQLRVKAARAARARAATDKPDRRSGEPD